MLSIWLRAAEHAGLANMVGRRVVRTAVPIIASPHAAPGVSGLGRRRSKHQQGEGEEEPRKRGAGAFHSRPPWREGSRRQFRRFPMRRSHGDYLSRDCTPSGGQEVTTPSQASSTMFSLDIIRSAGTPGTPRLRSAIWETLADCGRLPPQYVEIASCSSGEAVANRVVGSVRKDASIRAFCDAQAGQSVRKMYKAHVVVAFGLILTQVANSGEARRRLSIRLPRTDRSSVGPSCL